MQKGAFRSGEIRHKVRAYDDNLHNGLKARERGKLRRHAGRYPGSE